MTDSTEESISSSEQDDGWLMGWCCCGGGTESRHTRDSAQLELLQLPASDASTGTLASSRPGTPSGLVSQSAFRLSANYDPQREYVQHFGRESDALAGSQSDRTVSIRTEANCELVRQASETLESAVTHRATGQRVTPREIARQFVIYETAIHLEADPEKRGRLILEYEQYKSALDLNNLDDRQKALYFTEDARNEKLEPVKRLDYYRKAVQYTNDERGKTALRNEYHQFCESLKTL